MIYSTNKSHLCGVELELSLRVSGKDSTRSPAERTRRLTSMGTIMTAASERCEQQVFAPRWGEQLSAVAAIASLPTDHRRRVDYLANLRAFDRHT